MQAVCNVLEQLVRDAEREYHLAPWEVALISNNLQEKAKNAQRSGRARPFAGDIEAALQD